MYVRVGTILLGGMGQNNLVIEGGGKLCSDDINTDSIYMYIYCSWNHKHWRGAWPHGPTVLMPSYLP